MEKFINDGNSISIITRNKEHVRININYIQAHNDALIKIRVDRNNRVLFEVTASDLKNDPFDIINI